MEKEYSVKLQTPVSSSFRCQKAADSLDFDTAKKSKHELTVRADIEEDYSLGLIFGASGSGKTTLAKHIFGEDIFYSPMVEDTPIIEQFPDNFSYSQCAELLNGVGLTSVPCWIRPVYTLSNGQKARAEIALMLASDREILVIDEWTSVVDRVVAKAMSNNIQKMIRRSGKKLILLSCHYDVFEWLNPCWVIDCNKQSYTDRRSLWRNYQRKEKLEFQIYETERSSWKYFSKFHYLSERLGGSFGVYFGLFSGKEQIGFQAFNNYVPHRKNSGLKMQIHFNRTVIHPDYVGLGLGELLINETSVLLAKEFDVRTKFSSTPVYKILKRHPDKWKLTDIKRQIKKIKTGATMDRNGGFREKVKTYSYKWIGGDNGKLWKNR